jgi:tripartite-type tricarboxylate transporter receptor subunit TctC
MRQLLAPLAAATIVCAHPAAAQEFPVRQVRIVVPFPAGGSFDVMSRMLAQRMRRCRCAT